MGERIKLFEDDTIKHKSIRNVSSALTQTQKNIINNFGYKRNIIDDTTEKDNFTYSELLSRIKMENILKDFDNNVKVKQSRYNDRFDAIITSGDTEILVEYKDRDITSSFYPDTFVEKQKKLVTDKPQWIMIGFRDNKAYVFPIEKYYKKSTMECPKSTMENKGKKNKEFLHYLLSDAIFIIKY